MTSSELLCLLGEVDYNGGHMVAVERAGVSVFELVVGVFAAPLLFELFDGGTTERVLSHLWLMGSSVGLDAPFD